MHADKDWPPHAEYVGSSGRTVPCVVGRSLPWSPVLFLGCAWPGLLAPQALASMSHLARMALQADIDACVVPSDRAAAMPKVALPI